MRQRVHDTLVDDYGTVVEHLGGNLYRVDWDRRTPHQDRARVPIPSKHFEWARPEHNDGLEG